MQSGITKTCNKQTKFGVKKNLVPKKILVNFFWILKKTDPKENLRFKEMCDPKNFGVKENWRKRNYPKFFFEGTET